MARDGTGTDEFGRPIGELPFIQLVRLSLYWFGLSAIFSGLGGVILPGRLEFEGIVPRGEEGRALFLMTIGGTVIAMLIQPTIGSISDYTVSRWGRRKPYILVGSVLDVVFLYAIAESNTILAIAVFVALLQVSSNLAQGPFQGYVPDLVPAHQVGTASALVGIMQVLGNVGGFVVGSVGLIIGNLFLATLALGVIELLTMLSVFLWVDEGRVAKPRGGRSWRSVAMEAWGRDVLAERSYLWLVFSRLFVLMGGAMLVDLAVFYLGRSLGYTREETGGWYIVTAACVAIASVIATVPAARLSDRIGRKAVIYGSCALGVAGLLTVAAAPTVIIALVGVVLYGVSAGMFLSVDWALMTDIIPKASSGRYMGLSNVATAASGIFAIAIGGLVMDAIGGPERAGSGPRAAFVVGAALLAFGSLLLRPVDPTRRAEEAPDPTDAATDAPTDAPTGAPPGPVALDPQAGLASSTSEVRPS